MVSSLQTWVSEFTCFVHSYVTVCSSTYSPAVWVKPWEAELLQLCQANSILTIAAPRTELFISVQRPVHKVHEPVCLQALCTYNTGFGVTSQPALTKHLI